jgi:hypothetical protein
MHYIKLVLRSVLFLTATLIYVLNRIFETGKSFGGLQSNPWVLGIIWLIFVVEMILRFFPSKIESMGCQKQFKKNYIPSETCEKPKSQSWKVTFLVAFLWLLLNGIIGGLYFADIIDRGILLLVCLAYSVCDMICILFFCPFQTWFMKNKCCTGCRIYNWDYAMMFTPLVFIANPYTWSLLGCALILLLRWEISYRLYPERFSENTNESLSCANCKEKLCSHKKQLRHFLKTNKDRFAAEGKRYYKKIKDKTIKK